MTFDEYQKEAMRTASSNLSPELEMAVRALGLCGEVGEFNQATLTGSSEVIEKEAGDVMWYVASLASSFGLDGAGLGIGDLATIEPTAGLSDSCLEESSAKLAEMVKKQVGHGKPANRMLVAMELSDVVREIAYLAPCSLIEVCQKNVKKLRVRYPEGFDLAIASTKKDSNE